MRLLAPALALSLLLSGCYELCGRYPETVDWKDPGFATVLLDAPAPGWTVQALAAPPGIPNSNPDLAAWNATIQNITLGRDRQDPHVLEFRLDAAGQLSLWLQGPELGGLRDDLAAALGDLTDGSDTERRAWTDALLEEPVELRDEQDGEVESLYRIMLPVERIDIDDLLAGNFPHAPTTRITADGWIITVALPSVEATQGTQVFTAGAGGRNTFRDETWAGEFPEEEALVQFQAAYESLGIGKPPDQASVSGPIC